MRVKLTVSTFVFLMILAIMMFKVIPTPQIQQLIGPVMNIEGGNAGPISKTHWQRQTFVPKKNIIYGAAVNFTFWNKVSQDTIITLRLSEIGRSKSVSTQFSQEKIIAQDKVKANHLLKNTDYLFWFGRQKLHKNNLYALTLLTNKTRPEPLTVFTSARNAYPLGDHFDGDLQKNNDIIFQIYTMSSLSVLLRKIKMVDFAHDKREAAIYKNDKWAKKYSIQYYPLINPKIILALVILLAFAVSCFLYYFP